jgi:hypothetical protein
MICQKKRIEPQMLEFSLQAVPFDRRGVRKLTHSDERNGCKRIIDTVRAQAEA